MVLNAALAIGLSPVVGFIAAAIGTTLTGWATVLLLWRGARDMGEAATWDDRFRRRVWRIVGASLGMGAVLWIAQMLLGPFFGSPGLRYLALALLIAVGIASYAVLGQALGAFRLSEFKRNLRRSGRA